MTMSIQSASPPFVGQRCRWGKQNNHATLEPPVTVLGPSIQSHARLSPAWTTTPPPCDLAGRWQLRWIRRG
ncbi:MAG: hypothetical protein OXC47_01160 [Cyanobacteria bacterium MAG APA_bin_95]|nr:hypothetical protein [Cyanobacteria bacterium MAG APA_bin_95]